MVVFDPEEQRQWLQLMKDRGINTWFYIGWFPVEQRVDGLGFVFLQSYITIATMHY